MSSSKLYSDAVRSGSSDEDVVSPGRDIFYWLHDKKIDKTLFNHGKKLIRIYNKTYCDRQNIEYKYIVYETSNKIQL